jgi:hypothetical protein
MTARLNNAGRAIGEQTRMRRSHARSQPDMRRRSRAQVCTNCNLGKEVAGHVLVSTANSKIRADFASASNFINHNTFPARPPGDGIRHRITSHLQGVPLVAMRKSCQEDILYLHLADATVSLAQRCTVQIDRNVSLSDTLDTVSAHTWNQQPSCGRNNTDTAATILSSPNDVINVTVTEHIDTLRP